jgi:ubiquinone/menaquinone biosynthesis C-methylase UbiE
MSAYKKLCTEFYDATKPYASTAEVAFYTSALQSVNGSILEAPILEAMCGSGRLLIPLLEQGFLVEGVDNSVPMLESCAQRAAVRNLNPILYQQSIETMVLPKKYEAIIIAVGSFQLITDRSVAFATLCRLREYLLPGGILLLDTFVPWDMLGTGRLVERVERSTRCSDGIIIVLNSELTIDVPHQLYHAKNLYTKMVDGIEVETEEENLSIRWYYFYEMELMLEKAGFTNCIRQSISFSKDGPEVQLYRATAN